MGRNWSTVGGWLSAWLLFLCVLAAACGSDDPSAPAPAPTFARAAAYSGARNEHALLVARGAKVLFERYGDDFASDLPHRLASGTKSFSGVMAVAAAEDGLLDLDERVADTITEWRADQQKSTMTIRQLLTLTGGIGPGETGVIPTYEEAIAAPMRYPPGLGFAYGPVPFQVFGELMRRKLETRREGPLDYLQRRIFEPIGLHVDFWRLSNGQPQLPAGAFLTARNWALFGRLIQQEGQWEGRTIVGAERLRECFEGTRANPRYGITFWLVGAEAAESGIATGTLAPGALPRSVYAAGAGRQRLYVLPAPGVVVVRFGESEDFDWNDREFLTALEDDLRGLPAGG